MMRRGTALALLFILAASEDDLEDQGLARSPAGFEPFVTQWPEAKKYEEVDRSHDWCPLKAAILSGEVLFKDALRGKELSMLFAHTNSPLSVQYNASTMTVEGGLSVEVFEVLAKAAGFRWRKTAAVVDYVDRSRGEKDDEWLDWATRHYDLVDWFTITVNRSERGFAFAFPFINVSPHLVGKFELKQQTYWERLFTLFHPFSLGLWVMILVSFLLAAPFYMCIEHAGELDGRTVVGGMGQSFFNTFGQCTGGGGFAPQTPAGKIYVVSASLLAMILVTSYTANLATQMITDEVPMSTVGSFADVLARDLPICVRRDSPYSHWLSENHPGIKFYLVNTEPEKLEAVHLGKCAAAVVGELAWDFESRMSSTNPHCQLDIIGRKLVDMRGSFMTNSIDGKCKDLLVNIMAFHMQQLYLSGYVQMVEGVYIENMQDVYCSSQVQSSEMTMQIRHMGGAFLLHALIGLLCVAISVHSGQCYLPGKGDSTPKGSDGSSNEESESGPEAS